MITISTIIPVYNGGATIRAAIDSALAQDFAGQEIIVVNDGSTDHTAEALTGYGDRIRLIDQPNGGAAHARNAGILVARGEYIALLDADDVWLPGRLATTVDALRNNPEAALAFSDYERVDHAGNVVARSTVPAHLAHPPTMNEMLSHWWPIAPTTVTMRRDIWVQCGGFRAGLRGFEDPDFFIRARERGEFEFLAESLAVFLENVPEVAPDKWNPGAFIELIRERYGVRARGLLSEINNHYSGAFACKALRAMSQGDRKEAIRCWLKTLRYNPLYPFQAAHLARLTRRHNLKRIAKMLRPKPDAQ